MGEHMPPEEYARLGCLYGETRRSWGALGVIAGFIITGLILCVSPDGTVHWPQVPAMVYQIFDTEPASNTPPYPQVPQLVITTAAPHAVVANG